MIEPINNNALLIEEKETETKSGIVIPNGNKSGFFTVYEIPENEWEIKKGTRVIASKFAGERDVEIREGDKKILVHVCPVDSIIAIVHD